MESTKPALLLLHNGQVITDFSELNQNIRSDEIKQIIIQAKNISKSHVIEEMRFTSNVPEKAYSVILPKSIRPGRTAPVTITIDGKTLFQDDSIASFTFAIQYEETKYIGVN